MRHLWSWIIASGLVCGCGSEVVEKRKEWAAKAPDTYVVGTCAYGFVPRGCQLVAVDRGQVIGAEQRGSRDASWMPLETSEEPIEHLFSLAEDADDDCDVDVHFDPRLSYPIDVYASCGEEGSGERVACFMADTLDLESCRGSTVWAP